MAKEPQKKPDNAMKPPPPPAPPPVSLSPFLTNVNVYVNYSYGPDKHTEYSAKQSPIIVDKA